MLELLTIGRWIIWLVLLGVVFRESESGRGGKVVVSSFLKSVVWYQIFL